jgi:rhodanese-related sulfurtransferase
MTIRTISPRDLEQLRQQGTQIDLIDVRTPAEFGGVHVEFARNIPLDRLDCEAIMASRNGSGDQPLYILCRSGSRGKNACEKFVAAGFSNVVNVDGGTLGCVEAGLPVVRGKEVLPLDRQVRIAAGFLIVLGVVLGWFVNPYFHWLAAACGAGLMHAGITDSCMMGMLFARMPWNQVKDSSAPVAGDCPEPSCCEDSRSCCA